MILDAIGGESLRRSYKLLRPGGRLVAFGASSVVTGEKRNLLKAAPAGAADVPRLQPDQADAVSKAVIGLNMLALWDDRGTLEPWIAPLRDAARRRHARSRSSTTRPVRARAPRRTAIIEQRRNVGKVVLVP